MIKPINKGKEPLVSIITPLYNAQNYISATISSIQSQTYKNWEHIIVDDCSSDRSAAIVKQYVENDNRIRLTSLLRNSGAAYARNKATEDANGEYIAFLDADDLWHPEKLSKQIAFMKANDCTVSYTNYLHIDNSGELLRKRIKALPELSYKKQHTNNYIGNLTGIYHSKSIGKIIAPNIKKRQDWAVWLEAIKKSKKSALGLQEDLAFYRIHDISMSSNKLSLIKYNYQFYKRYLGYSFPKATLYLFRFFWEYFTERKKWIENY